jgi:hypothetical protein
MKKILLIFMIVVVSFSCIDNNVKTDSHIIKSKELQSIIKEHIKEIKNISDLKFNDSLLFISISFYSDNQLKKMSINTHALSPIFKPGINIEYKGNCFFEGRNILIYDQEEIGKQFLNYNQLQHDSVDKFENKSCNEESFLNTEVYKIEGNKLFLLEKRIIPNIKMER